MELKDKVAQLALLLEEHPRLEKFASLASLASKLEKAMDVFLSKAEGEIYRNTAEYAELIALLTNTQNKALVTARWMSERAAAEGRKFTKNGKKEKEEFALIMVKTGNATALIKEIKETPMRQMQDELNRLALATDKEVAATIKAMKSKQFEEFCQYNDIKIIRTARGKVDKTRTQPHILQKLAGRREYVKL